MTAAAELPYEAPAAPTARPLPVGVRPVSRRRPALELVATARRDAPQAPFVAVVVALLVAGLLGLLVLNTALAKDAFAVYALSQDSRTLADQEQSLSREVEALRSPPALAAKAVELGMVQAGPPAFLRLPDGVVLGAPAPALGSKGSPAGPGSSAEPRPAPDAGTGDASASDDTEATGGDPAHTEPAASAETPAGEDR